MYQDNRILCLIPARGGSKGIPGKNIKEIAGRPLISYSIKAARDSKYIDDVVVTTDSEEIAAVAMAYGAEVPFMRPAELAGDHAKSIDAVLHAVDTLARMSRTYHSVVLLQPTSPLRRSVEVDESIDLFYRRGCLGLASVSKASENPVFTRRMDHSGVMHPLLPVSSTVRRQDLPTFWHVDGAIYINRTDELDEETSLNDNPIGYAMQDIRSFDIDDIGDFYKAELAIRKLEEERPEPVG